jgi:hypothetical protein
LAPGDIQRREDHCEDHWAIVELVGKAGHVRTVPVPAWVKTAVDRWTESASIANGRLFRSIRKDGTVWGDGITQNVIWYVVKGCAVRVGIKTLAPHTSEGPAHVCAMPQAANWNRSNSCWDMRPFRQPNGTCMQAGSGPGS